MSNVASMLVPGKPSAHGAERALLGGPIVGDFWQKMMKPKAPPAPGAVPPAPTLGNSQDSLDVAAQQQQLGIQRGLTSTMLTGGSGLSNTGSTSKVLLGG